MPENVSPSHIWGADAKIEKHFNSFLSSICNQLLKITPLSCHPPSFWMLPALHWAPSKLEAISNSHSSSSRGRVCIFGLCRWVEYGGSLQSVDLGGIWKIWIGKTRSKLTLPIFRTAFYLLATVCWDDFLLAMQNDSNDYHFFCFYPTTWNLEWTSLVIGMAFLTASAYVSYLSTCFKNFRVRIWKKYDLSKKNSFRITKNCFNTFW